MRAPITVSLQHEAAIVGQANLRRQIEEAALEAFDHGMDFVHGPFEFSGPDPWHEPFWSQPMRQTIGVKGGPASPGMVWPRDYTVYSVERWRAAGCPGKLER